MSLQERKDELSRVSSRLQSSIDEIERLKAEGEAKDAAGLEAAQSAKLYKQQLERAKQQNSKLQTQVDQMRRDHAAGLLRAPACACSDPMCAGDGSCLARMVT